VILHIWFPGHVISTPLVHLAFRSSHMSRNGLTDFDWESEGRIRWMRMVLTISFTSLGTITIWLWTNEMFKTFSATNRITLRLVFLRSRPVTSCFWDTVQLIMKLWPNLQCLNLLSDSTAEKSSELGHEPATETGFLCDGSFEIEYD
jgi:hypothetical protein